MTAVMAARALNVDLLVRELGNWRTSTRSGPAYHGLADAIRLPSGLKLKLVIPLAN